MAKVTQRGFTVPRWLYDAIQVPVEQEDFCPPSSFENNTWYRMRLIGLSFTGEYVVTRSAIPSYPAYHPHWARQLLVDIGKSGYSDQNLVRASLASLCATPHHAREKMGANNMGRHYDLATPYKLPRDEGLRVQVAARWPGFVYVDGDDDPVMYGDVPEATFIAKGYSEDGYPVMLAGASGHLEINGQDKVMNSADLFNNGKCAAYLTSFHFKCMDTIGVDYDKGAIEYGWKGSATHYGWRVNPVNPGFTEFMPAPLLIPTGNLTPLDRNYDGGSESPLCYWFPEGTYLDPKQELAVRLASIRPFVATETPELLNLCLFGELEVQ